MVAIDHRSNCSGVFREETQVEHGVALLNHATQQASGVDTTLGLVDGAAIAAHLLGVAGAAFAFFDQPLARGNVGVFENVGLGVGPSG